MASLSSSCTGSHRVLYWAFKNNPLFKRLFRDKAKLLEFFYAIELLTRSRLFRAICVVKAGRVLSVAILHDNSNTASGISREALTSLLRSISLSLLLEVMGWLGESVRYRGLLKRFENSCHLVFLASLIPGKGYGSSSLRGVEVICKKMGKDWILLDVDVENRALRFYSRRGYRPVGVALFSGRNYVVLAKPLQCYGARGTGM
ncbi:hypothetical protein MA03_03450 [Infirmifilum uzonense]|uniref:N-acetyltransferase domain-containing protein n=1 Tax=Infirmifilum uzonense TaxID=1550241 RepID=A0A0F7FH47_9CREN|nr:GNAT family N-acetyltransferase [Infirmifilum uzonense]AKG38527.1 hypothetical protein MA03_03450 [Infirmifilum uzonense]